MLNTADKIVSVDSVVAEGDGAAMEMAGQLILSKHAEFAAMEVWDWAVRWESCKPDREASLGFAPQDIVVRQASRRASTGATIAAAMMP